MLVFSGKSDRSSFNTDRSDFPDSQQNLCAAKNHWELLTHFEVRKFCFSNCFFRENISTNVHVSVTFINKFQFQWVRGKLVAIEQD